MYVPSQIFFTSGIGVHREKLNSFELALRDAGIASLNLVRVSSILPPHCKIISRRVGEKMLTPGQIVHCVLAQADTSEPKRLIAASIGVAVPKDAADYGYLSEHHGYGMGREQAGEYTEDMAAEMLATILGVAFDPDKSWNEKKELWRISGKIVRTRNTTRTAYGDKDGRWTTVLAVAVLLPPPALNAFMTVSHKHDGGNPS